jgi:hypothetical protein
MKDYAKHLTEKKVVNTFIDKLADVWTERDVYMVEMWVALRYGKETLDKVWTVSRMVMDSHWDYYEGLEP